MHSENLLLDNSFHVPWSKLTADLVEPGMDEAIQQGTAGLEAIKAIPDGEETFENTFVALEKASDKVSEPWHKVNHLTAVNDHAELRAAHLAALPKVSAFFADIPLDQDLYRKLKNFAATDAAKALDAVEARFVEETLHDFEDSGANLPDATRDRLREIESILAEKTKTFSDNVLDSTNAFERIVDSVEQLAGLPESFVEGARLDALKKGIGTEEEPKYRFTLHAPSFIPVMRFVDDDGLRRELLEAYLEVGHSGKFENEPLIREILALRTEKAKLLGKNIFPDWVLSRRMAKSGQRALAFVEDLQQKTKPAFDREVVELQEFKAAHTGGEPDPLNQWEVAYWSEKRRKEHYDFDEEVLRPYFPMESVMTGMFKLVERIFGITVKEVTDPKPDTWHPEVQLFAIHDSADGRHLGSFYTDWYPRESKRSGAWMSFMITGEPMEDGTLSPHLGQIAGNLTPPVGDKPALLNHSDVETVFHEFGHLLHHLLSEVKIPSLAGVNVAWDFVELPSQIMENWCWERESLDLFARHYETGETIPEDLFQKMKTCRNLGAARMQMRQLSLGKMDLALHMEFDPGNGADMDAFIKDSLNGYLPPVNVELNSGIRSFGHLFSDATGYAAGYYSYKWAEVLDADAFTRFAKEGILNQETGLAFRKSVLAMGNAKDPAVLFRDFMGRDPDPDALLRRLDLLGSN
ncbi:MAG: M3 family metallopeptidase [Puniceicoccaceae bacterium]